MQKAFSIYTYPPGLQTHLPREPRSSGEDTIMIIRHVGLFHPAHFFEIFSPHTVKETQGLLFREKTETVTCQAVDMQAVDTQPTLGQVSVTKRRNLRCSAIQASGNASAFAGSLEERSVLSCVTKLSCYDPADGGGHFPGNEVTDGH